MTKPEPEFSTLETAYWAWVKRECPFPEKSKDRADWMKSNPFEFEGVRFERRATPLRSNSGKSIVQWQVIFVGSDGTIVSNELVRNRRNDPDRNWGLGRD